jgi:hypothetical protein
MAASCRALATGTAPSGERIVVIDPADIAQLHAEALVMAASSIA